MIISRPTGISVNPTLKSHLPRPVEPFLLAQNHCHGRGFNYDPKCYLTDFFGECNLAFVIKVETRLLLLDQITCFFFPSVTF